MKMTLVALTVAVVSLVSLAKDSGEKSWDGYLIDKLCATHTISKKLGPDKTDAKMKSHTRECAMMDDCVQSGYGIWTAGAFVQFDKAGNEQVAKLLAKSQKKDNIAITVTGKMNGKSLAVTTVKEK